jgi:hypothetical protein
MAGFQVTGVWMSNEILDESEGARGDAVLKTELKIPRKKPDIYVVSE